MAGGLREQIVSPRARETRAQGANRQAWEEVPMVIWLLILPAAQVLKLSANLPSRLTTDLHPGDIIIDISTG